MADPIQFDLTRSTGYVFWILASCGKQLRISLPANVASAYFSAYLGRQGVWLSYWTLAVKPRGQTYVAGEVSVRLQVPIDH